MTQQAKGTFTVQATQKTPFDTAPGATLTRMSLSKVFSGDFKGTSVVEMLSAVSEYKGSAGYVALERVTGELQGKRGTFVLQHNGTMARGNAGLDVMVVPDSGTGELTNLSGRMTIDIIDGQHFYGFEYEV